MVSVFVCFLLLSLSFVVNGEREREGAAKDYPAPLFIWAENDRYLQGGRQWVSESVSNAQVLQFLSSLSSRDATSSQSIFPSQDAPLSPEVVVLFLQPQLLFGLSERYGGNRFSSSHLQLKKLKRIIEGSFSSVVAPYTYDLSFSLPPPEHENQLMMTWAEMIGDYLDGCGQTCNLYVDVVDEGAVRVWEPLLITNPNILKVEGESYFELNSHVFTNGLTDLLIVHLTSDLTLADLKVAKVIESISHHTKSYVSLFTADDMYLPTHSTQTLRETSEKWEWTERKAQSPSPSPSPAPANNNTPSGPFRYDSRWPEFVWEFLLSFLLLVIIFAFGVCCLCGIDTPRRFDNPKEKGL